MPVIVELRKMSEIKEKLVSVEEDGGEKQHTEGVLFNKDIIQELYAIDTLVVSGVFKYSDKYAIGLKKANGATTYVSPSWIKSLTDGVITIGVPKNSAGDMDMYVEVKGGILLHKDKLTLVKREDLTECSCCGRDIEEDRVLTKEKMCKKCFVEKYYKVNNYSYKPTPIFVGEQLPADVDTPTWYGVELEFGLNSRLSVCKAIASEKIYLKSDASIENGTDGGTEMVTHPHSFQHLMSEESWINKLPIIDCNKSDKNGCHIHVGRTAWATDKHYALTFYLMYEMGQVTGEALSMLEQIGGRKFTNYCMRDIPTTKIHRVKKDGAKSDANRSVWLNERNEATVEFRFFSGTNKAEEMKRYVQLLEAVIKYTKYNSKQVSVTGLVGYVKKYKGKYEQLHTFLESKEFNNTAIVIFKEPIKKGFDMSRLPFDNIYDIITITKRDGTVYKEVDNIYIEGRTMSFKALGASRRVGYTINLSDISSVEVEM